MGKISDAVYKAAWDAVNEGRFVTVVWGTGLCGHLALPSRKYERTLCGRTPDFNPNVFTDRLVFGMCQRCMHASRNNTTIDDRKRNPKLFAVTGHDHLSNKWTTLYRDRGLLRYVVDMPEDEGPRGPKHEIVQFWWNGRNYDVEWMD
jgi:hypothetical protein